MKWVHPLWQFGQICHIIDRRRLAKGEIFLHFTLDWSQMNKWASWTRLSDHNTHCLHFNHHKTLKVRNNSVKAKIITSLYHLQPRSYNVLEIKG